MAASIRRIFFGICLTTFLLSGCANLPQVHDSLPSTGAQSQTPNFDQSPSVPKDEVSRLNKSCSDLLSIEQIYDFNPNFSLDTKTASANASIVSAFKGLEGTNCAITHLSNSSHVFFSVARVSQSSKIKFQQLISDYSRATNPLFPNGDKDIAFFYVGKAGGELDYFTGYYWIHVESALFTSQEDSKRLVVSILRSLGI